MKYFKTKHEKDSARITALLAVILILLIFIVGPKYLDPPEEYGVAVNFGTTDFGSGRVQPKEPIRQAPKEVVTPPKKVEEAKPTPSKPQETKAENVITEDNAESIAIKKQKEEALKKAKEEAKAKAEAERIEREKKAEADRLEKERKEQKAKRDAVDGLLGGIKNSDGTDSGSEGDDNKAGDKGQLNGDPYAPSYFGEPGAGGGGSGYGLRGRGRPSKSKVLPECNEEGKVVVEIHVNRQGNVVNAIPGKRGTTGVSCLYDAAKKTALTYKWPADSKAPTKQVGFVVINFSVTQ
ncbi:energy transducer TonB [Flavobacteriaceae bacterium S0825]|uniref:energy transducer TonB n=1 Tax=Gaetbulibacter sp. S0825 TaxID=2720084 RepID=UPI00143081EA|nr:energy transducer TonB [Gaetbulibacter sp. S0825]MCK0110464.1 energy transducer TonB [Flavobacteriaceae bacterium S0825]NIX66093.1 energy transducer TonB [Gaetbulibacter sp. S0825]